MRGLAKWVGGILGSVIAALAIWWLTHPGGPLNPKKPPRPPPSNSPVANYLSQPSYSGNCRQRPQGSVCLGFGDGYIWLVYDSITGRGTKSDAGQQVEVAFGGRADYYHVPGTTLVRTVSK